MPDYVLKNSAKDVGPYVLSLPEGSTQEDLDAALELHKPGGWSLDKKTDPASVAAAAEQPAVPAPKKENA